jgi:hypothetical protein
LSWLCAACPKSILVGRRFLYQLVPEEIQMTHYRAGASLSDCRVWLAAAWVAISCLAAPALAAQDLIVFNADVYTMDAGKPRVQAFAVKDGKVIAIGANEEIQALANAATRRIDAGGKTVTPGFIDAHQHLVDELTRSIST